MPQQASLPNNALSPSSASSCSDYATNLPTRGVAGVYTQASPPLVARSVNYIPSMLQLPHTPPVPQVPQRLLYGWQQQGAFIGAPTMIAPPHGGQQMNHMSVSSGYVGGSIQVQPHRDEDADLSQHNISDYGQPAPTPSYGGSMIHEPGKPGGLQHSQSVMQLQVQQMAPDAGSANDLDSRLRKSRSTTSMRNLSINAVALSSGQQPQRQAGGSVTASSQQPPNFASPLIGHRATLQGALNSVGASPMRGSLSNAPGSLASSASMSALPGNTSPLIVPKRSLLQNGGGGNRGPQRPNGSVAAPSPLPPHAPESLVARQSTPVPQPTKHHAEVRTRGSAGAAAAAAAATSGHSPSPVMMRRSVSTQALRIDRQPSQQALGAGGSKPAHHEKAAPRAQPAPGGPSPERQRPSGAAPPGPPGQGPPGQSAVSPIRTMSPAHRLSQRQL